MALATSEKKGGPFTKNDQEKRRNEVYRLHFEYSYSAVKIAELMKVNRNTIHKDIQYWYAKIAKKHNIYNPEYTVIKNIQRFEIQRTRLREQLDKTESFQEKLAIERFIFDIDSKIMQIYIKFTDSTKRVVDLSSSWLNNWMKKHDLRGRWFNSLDMFYVSDKATEKINKIIKEDNKRVEIL